MIIQLNPTQSADLLGTYMMNDFQDEDYVDEFTENLFNRTFTREQGCIEILIQEYRFMFDPFTHQVKISLDKVMYNKSICHDIRPLVHSTTSPIHIMKEKVKTLLEEKTSLKIIELTYNDILTLKTIQPSDDMN